MCYGTRIEPWQSIEVLKFKGITNGNAGWLHRHPFRLKIGETGGYGD